LRVVICGGGAIGASIAYFLSLRRVEAVIVERCAVACAASGRSGGFLALDWCDGTPLEALARRSFALHAELAATLPADWGYRRLDTLSVVAGDRAQAWPRPAGAPEWLGAGARVRGALGDRDSTAQVDPAAFTRALADAAVAGGGRCVHGAVTGLLRSADGASLVGVRVEDDEVAADAVVIAMGPWSVLASFWLPLPAVYALKGHSLLFRPQVPLSPHALFVEYATEDGDGHTPELFPRADGTAYVCGLSCQSPLPLDPGAVRPDPGACDELRRITARLVPELAAAPLLAAQACHRPVIEDNLPLMGRIQGLANAYVATGHGVWGILNAPASGEAMAELILDGWSRTLDLSPFDPARLPAYRPG
jgi:glycine/D-amino acid oxidase-like deaminating enzyme